MKPLFLKGVSKSFQAGQRVIDHLSFAVEEGEIAAVVGESGSGKTTILRLIAGFEVPDEGSIYLNNTEVAGGRRFIRPEERHVGLVFQDLALFPHLNVKDNIGFGIRNRSEKREAVGKLLELVELQELGDRYPHQLSGGQKQRVAIARALAIRPALLLLDEPFSSLDRQLRNQVRSDIKRIIQQSGKSAVIVTHDMDDAFAMADRVLVMQGGKLLQDSRPEEIYNRPSCLYVAQLGGKVNVIHPEHAYALGFHENSAVSFIRPEHTELRQESPGLKATIVSRVFSGIFYEYSVLVGPQEYICHSSQNFSPGEEVFLFFIPEYIHQLNE